MDPPGSAHTLAGEVRLDGHYDDQEQPAHHLLHVPSEPDLAPLD
jgi:hypothetical protein